MPHADHSCVDARLWAVEQALPLWAGTGYDDARGLFHERLDYQRNPLALPGLRLMVQARQIATYARASLRGWFDARDKALVCVETIRRLYHRADGAPGWVFSIGPDNRPVNTTRDLYAHAFVLYALAWAHRVTSDAGLVQLADATLAEMDEIFAAPNGGYLDSNTAPKNIRNQNPHMHMLEALLALAEATGLERYHARAEALCSLACKHYVTAQGALIEEYDATWQPLQVAGQNRVEPGHIFEWAWLIGEVERLSRRDLTDVRMRLLAFGTQHGVDATTGLAHDAINDRGELIAGTLRLWPQSERIKALAMMHRLGDDKAASQADTLIASVMRTFSLDRLQGGWVDQCDTAQNRRVDYMPASSLYHIMGAIFDADAAFVKPGACSRKV